MMLPWQTMWVITFSATFAYLFRYATEHARLKGQPLSLCDCAKTFLLVSSFSTPIMMVQMTALQFGSGVDLVLQTGVPPCPIPGLRGFTLLIIRCACPL
jgi:hypothetical protein